MRRKKQKSYAIYIVHGRPYETSWDLEFITLYKQTAENWVNKYNRIVENNKDRAKEIMESDEDYHLMESYWIDFIYYENPVAEFKEVELR